MGRAVTVSSTALGTVKWTVDRDCLLTRVTATAAQVCISRDPKITVANVTTPTATDVTFNHICSVWQTLDAVQLNIELEQGRDIFIAFAAAGSAIMTLEDLARSVAEL